ncbi:aldehyde dehydrogenase family protein [bacterium]|nr:MAG: aldehyde dehydrogenase family protein [bacterium]
MEALKSNIAEPLVTSWIWGERAGNGSATAPLSPVDGLPLGHTQHIDEEEMEALLAPLGQTLSISEEEVRAFATRLHAELRNVAAPIFEALRRETGFVARDCAEVRDGIVLYARDFWEVGFMEAASHQPQSYRFEDADRDIRQVSVPWGTIVVVLPSSATLLLAVTCLLNALATGNRVILRFPAASPLSASLLCEAVELAQPPKNSVSIVMAPAKTLLSNVHENAAHVLIHYLGSSRHAPALVVKGFENGKSVIADGEGNTWIWVSAKADVDKVIETLTQGALRYNGQTCTSVNGALIHPTIYNVVREALIKRWNALQSGKEANADVGPLGDEGQAEWCQERVETSGGQIVCGGKRDGSFLAPTLVEAPREDSDLVTQGLFGPALWIAQGDENKFMRLWATNHFPLCAGILEPEADAQSWATRLGNVARLVLNGDPSVEWTFEPWGGYPASGNNPVSTWADKYRRVVAVDANSPKASN